MADVLKVEPTARIRLTKNGIRLYEQRYDPVAQAFTEYTADRLILATNMTAVSEVNLGGVATGEFLLVQTDQQIKLGVDNQTTLWTFSGAAMLAGSSFTHVYLKNESTTNTATVEIIVVD